MIKNISNFFKYCIMRWFTSPETFIKWYLSKNFGGVRLKDGTWAAHQSDEFHSYCYEKAYYSWKKTTGLRPSFSFMRDNHTFIQLQGHNVDQIKQHAIEVARQNKYGMVCSVRILDGEKELRSVGDCCHVDGDGNVDLTKWFDDIMKEDCIRNYRGF